MKQYSPSGPVGLVLMVKTSEVRGRFRKHQVGIQGYTAGCLRDDSWGIHGARLRMMHHDMAWKMGPLFQEL